MGDMHRALRESKKKIRDEFGVACPMCVDLLPKACPTILLPKQKCKMHNYRDPRTRTDETNHFMHAKFKD